MTAMYAKEDGRWVAVYPDASTDIPSDVASGGVVDTIMYEGVLHRRHTFYSSGTITFNREASVVLFMVGGGGAAGNATGVGYETGGGGAGRVRWTRITCAAGDYAVTVGAGGVAGNGGQSEFDGLVAEGGRRGATGGSAGTGGVGSGGGGAHDRTAGGVTTTPTDATTYATNGGRATAASRGAGGGGAKQAGQNTGPGGAGIEFPAGSGVYYAGGGAGCVPGTTVAGGVGGGGRSINGQLAGEAGSDGTGGGGGAGTNSPSATGAKGGSGVVQILYPLLQTITLSVDKAPGQVTLTWTEISGASEYQIDMDGTRSWDAGSPLVVTGLTDDVPHTWKVRALMPDGRFSAWSNAVTESSGQSFNEATGGTVTEVTNYNGTGETWRVHTFTANGTFTVAASGLPFRVFLNGGGGGGGAMDGNWHGCGGNGGYDTQDDAANIPVGDHTVVIGTGGGTPYEGTWSSGGVGGVSSLGSLFTANGGEGGSPPGVNNGNYWSGASNGGTTSIRGTSESFGNGGPADSPPWYPSAGVNTGNGGSGSHTGRGDPGGPRGGVSGAAGIVIVAYRIA